MKKSMDKKKLKEKIELLKQKKANPTIKPKKEGKKKIEKEDIDNEEIIRRLDNKIQEEKKDKMYYEKMVLSNPNDNELWIQYITFTYESEV